MVWTGRRLFRATNIRRIMKKRKQRTSEEQRALEAALQALPRCARCNQMLTSHADRSKPSELVEYMGIHWTPKHPQYMWMYPSAELELLCPYCQSRLNPPKAGKEGLKI